MKKPETIAELEHEVVKRAEEHTIAKAELDAKTAEDKRLQEKEAQKKREHEDAKAKLAEARAEEKRKEFARALDPPIEALGGARKAVAAGNERALAAALP
jgi:chromosome segregation ATPase